MSEPAGWRQRAVAGAGLDPITFSVMLNRFDAIASEMSLAVERSAWSSVLGLCRDYSCAIYDAVPRQICDVRRAPDPHARRCTSCCKEIADRFEGDIAEGDVFVCNDPYRGNTHIGDLVIAAPVFFDGRLVVLVGDQGPPAGHRRLRRRRACTASARERLPGGHHDPADAGSSSAGGDARGRARALPRQRALPRDARRGRPAGPAGLDRARAPSASSSCATSTAPRRCSRYVDAMIDYADRRMAEEIEAMPDGDLPGRGLGRQRRLRAEHIPVQGRGDDRRRPGHGRLHGQRAAGAGRHQRHATRPRMAAGTMPFLLRTSTRTSPTTRAASTTSR